MSHLTLTCLAPAAAGPSVPIPPAPLTAQPFAVARLKHSSDQAGRPYTGLASEFGFQVLGVLAQEVGEDRALAFAARLTSFAPPASGLPRQRQDWAAVLGALAAAAERP